MSILDGNDLDIVSVSPSQQDYLAGGGYQVPVTSGEVLSLVMINQNMTFMKIQFESINIQYLIVTFLDLQGDKNENVSRHK